MTYAASDTQEEDPLAPSQQEKSKLQEEENCAPQTSRRQKKLQ